MFNSMTAFGRGHATADNKEITVEVRSVNNRYLDCNVRLPHGYLSVEDKFKPYLQSAGVTRGKVDINVNIVNTADAEVGFTVDEAYAKAYIAALYELRDKFSLPDDITVMRVAQNRDIFVSGNTEEEDTDKLWGTLRPVLDEALRMFIEARKGEGKRLYADIAGKIEKLRGIVAEIKKISDGNIASYRDKIEERIRLVLADNRVTVDENRLLTECAIAADKLAIDEEIVRLGSHFDNFLIIADSDEPAGRKLDFLVQEMNREVNTIGSKCQDSDIAKLVVECKSEIEKIREQIQNIE